MSDVVYLESMKIVPPSSDKVIGVLAVAIAEAIGLLNMGKREEAIEALGKAMNAYTAYTKTPLVFAEAASEK